jgi:adenine deaminase
MVPDPVRIINAARGLVAADAVFTNAEIFNPFTCSWQRGNLAVTDGIVLGTGEYSGETERDMQGSYLVPGLIDAHVHIESSLLTPHEYARLVAGSGTATVVADPHEIANVAGAKGIGYMLRERHGLPVDIRFMLPSCVPATPKDMGGAVLTASDLKRLKGRKGIEGLGEMMNFPGTLAADHEILEKISLFRICDGHAPLLSGKDLNAYICAGPSSDHECTRISEAEEKLEKGMYIYLREGSTEHNIRELAPVVTPHTVSRCCFATDDCHADLLYDDGHIDRCIRTAIGCGIEPELAIRMATLSAAERFGFSDRGALSPGRRADFCVVDDPEKFRVRQVFVAGKEYAGMSPSRRPVPPFPFRCKPPAPESIRISGKGTARVIQLVPHQIITEAYPADCDGSTLPDPGRDLMKVVVCNRYGTGSVGTGLVKGFGFMKGAIASTVAHDTHNLIAAGASDREILAAISEVVAMKGGMAAVIGDQKAILPLDCGGLMSSLPCEEVVGKLRGLHAMTRSMGGIEDPFMYLSFLSLTVIPALRITDRGVFDVTAFSDVPLFVTPS